MSSNCKETSPRSHIVITGTGRSGTTLLVQLFTALGLDTGYSLDEALKRVDHISQAGLEHWVADSTGQTVMKSPLQLGVPNMVPGEDLPYIVKSPMYATNLQALLESDAIRVRAVIVPMRQLFSAAESRRRVQIDAEKIGIDPDHVQGGLWGTRDAKAQEAILATNFYEMVLVLVRFGIETYWLEFPEFTQDGGRLYRSLQPLMTEHGIRETDVIQALSRVLRPDAIHSFGSEIETHPFVN